MSTALKRKRNTTLLSNSLLCISKNGRRKRKLDVCVCVCVCPYLAAAGVYAVPIHTAVAMAHITQKNKIKKQPPPSFSFIIFNPHRHH